MARISESPPPLQPSSLEAEPEPSPPFTHTQGRGSRTEEATIVKQRINSDLNSDILALASPNDNPKTPPPVHIEYPDGEQHSKKDSEHSDLGLEDGLLYSDESEEEGVKYLPMLNCRVRRPTPPAFYTDNPFEDDDNGMMPTVIESQRKKKRKISAFAYDLPGSFAEGQPVYTASINPQGVLSCKSYANDLKDGAKLFTNASSTGSAQDTRRLWLKCHVSSSSSRALLLRHFMDTEDASHRAALGRCHALTLAACDSEVDPTQGSDSSGTDLALLSHLLRDLIPLLPELRRLDLHRFHSSPGAVAWLTALDCRNLTQVHLGLSPLCVSRHAAFESLRQAETVVV